MTTISNIAIALVIGSFFMTACIHSDVVSVSEPEELTTDEEYLIFGTYYAFLSDNTRDAVDTYKLTHDALYVDSSNSWDIDKAQFTQLSDEKFELVKHLINKIPSDLIILNDSTFGCPDCADQGGINIRYHIDGVEKQWIIDQYNLYNPEFLHEFRNDINEKIQLLNPEKYGK